MIERPPFPEVIDDTILSTFRACPQKAFRTYVEHWKPQSESVHLIAGAAFARGVEVARLAFYRDGESSDNAEGLGAAALMEAYGDFEPPPDSSKSLERMLGALEFYFANYPLGADGAEPIRLAGGGLGIEFNFSEPLPISHPVTGNPLLFAGRADMIAHFADGVYLFDEKTASSLGASWGRQWELRSQFTGYAWAGRENGFDIKGCIVRGISILKTKYDTQQAITYRPAWEVERWFDQTCRDLERMLKCWEEGWWDFNIGHSCADYGGCPLTQVCKSPSPEDWLPVYFEKRRWDPLARKEYKVG
jgi:hypothetical protein